MAHRALVNLPPLTSPSQPPAVDGGYSQTDKRGLDFTLAAHQVQHGTKSQPPISRSEGKTQNQEAPCKRGS